MYKIQIQARCANCGGKAYVDLYEVVDESGESSTRFRQCVYCQGSGNQTRWVTFSEYVDMVNEEIEAWRMLGGNDG